MISILLYISLFVLILVLSGLNIFSKKFIKLKITRQIFFIRISIFLLFFFIILFFIRIMNLFRIKTEINLVQIYFFIIKINLILIILIFITFLLFRSLIYFFFKKNFIIVHYYLLSNNNNYYYKNYYINVIRKFQYKKLHKNYFFYYFFRYLFIFIIGFILLFDFLFNDFVLFYSIEVFPYFGLYQLLYNFFIFLNEKINLSNDILISNYLYNNYSLGFKFTDLDKILEYTITILK